MSKTTTQIALFEDQLAALAIESVGKAPVVLGIVSPRALLVL